MVSSHKVRAVRRRKLLPWSSELIEVRLGAVVQVPADKHDVRLLSAQHGDNSPHEFVTADGTKMCVSHQRRHPPSPILRQIGQLDGDLLHAKTVRVDNAVAARANCQAERYIRDRLAVQGKPSKPERAIESPAQTRGKKAKTQDAQPDGCDGVIEPHDWVGKTEDEERGADKTDRQQR